LKQKNYDFVIRYLGGDASKVITKDEAGKIRHAQLDLVLVYESDPLRMRGGKSAGVADANEAVAEAHHADLPADFFCYFAWDPSNYDFRSLNSDLSLIYAYLDGAASVLGPSRVGFYGFYATVQAVLDNNKAAKAWQTSGQSEKFDSRAVLYQNSYNQFIFKQEYDGDVGYAVDIGQIRYAPAVATDSLNGVPVGYCPLTVDGTPVGTTDYNGNIVLPNLCGSHLVAARKGSLWYSQVINFVCPLLKSAAADGSTSTAADTTPMPPGNEYLVDMASDASCASLSSVANFSVGDTVEVYGTETGLRARYPDPCSESWIVMPDLSTATVIGASQCCNGYVRWKLRYDDLQGIEVWSAGGEPSTGQVFLRKKQNSTCSYSLAPGRLDLDTSGAAASGFNINTGSSCYWTAVSNLDWISITTNASGTGPAQVTFAVSANPNPYSRSGNVIVGDQTFIVTQPGTGSATSGWTLNVASSNPNSGVGITVSPKDTNGLGNGTTTFTRNYNAYTQVYVTAPAGAGSTTFKKWQRDGVDWSTSTDTNLGMEGNHTMTALYVPIPDRYLAVFISPQQAVDAGAKWYLQGTGPYDSGQAIGPFNPGTTVQGGLTCKSLEGWIAPPQQDVVTANSGPTIIRVSYTVPATLSLSANQINIGSSSSGANLLVTNTGGGTLNWSASTPDTWITIETAFGSSLAGATSSVAFSFAANNSADLRNGTVNISDSNANHSPQTITVTQLGVTPSPPPTATPTMTPTAALPAQLVNLSTRLGVETRDNAMIAGLIITGTQPKKVIVRGIGPSLPAVGSLADPVLELYDGSGVLLETNDNWIDSPSKQAIIDSTVPPKNDLESAIVRTLPANGAGYTAILRGTSSTTGIGLVEVYDLNSAADSKLANISTRGLVQTGDDVLIAGMIVVGETSRNVIIRAIGPSLEVPGKLADPILELHDGNGGTLESNDNWVDSPNKQAIIDSTIPPKSNLESAIVHTVVAGNYTAIVRGVNNGSGIAVVEAYDLGPAIVAASPTPTPTPTASPAATATPTATATATPGPNLIVNGSFESPGFIGGNSGGGRQQYIAPSTEITGWTVSGTGDVFVHKCPDIQAAGSTYCSPNDGAFYVDLSGSGPPHASISQDFVTTPGQLYQLSFFVGASSLNPPSSTINVQVIGANSLLNTNVTPLAPGTSINWSEKQFSFTANSTATSISFTDTSTADDNVSFIDNVTVR
jgi:Domain of unknown function (DUF1906)/Protein of unknown function (DUF642)/Viral BACON domain/Putative binding domain, N-terminal